MGAREVCVCTVREILGPWVPGIARTAVRILYETKRVGVSSCHVVCGASDEACTRSVTYSKGVFSRAYTRSSFTRGSCVFVKPDSA